MERSFLQRLGYMMFTEFNQRIQFYLAWSLTDLSCNMSGLGFNGYDANDQPKWDLMMNFKFLNIEVFVFWFSLNKDSIFRMLRLSSFRQIIK
jgi:lysophospholipid acyltransferase